MLKKLFELLKKPSEAEKQTEREERAKVQRSSRVKLMPLHDVYFRPAGEAGEPVIVANLSSTGMGLVRESGRYWPPSPAVVVGNLLISEKSIMVQVRVVRNTPSIVGCAFVSATDELTAAIEKYFLAELIASQMSEVNPEILKEEPDGRPRLFRSSKNCELFIVESDDQIVRFQLSFLGHYFEAGTGQPLRYGFTHGDNREKPQYKGSSLVRFTSQIPADVLSAASKFMANVQGLSKAQREAIEQALRGK